VAAVGVVTGLVLGVVASRAITSAFAALLRSRKVRDLAAVIIAVLASSIGPLQWLIISISGSGSLDQVLAVAKVLAWTPFGAPYVLAFDAADGRWLALAVRLAMTVAAIGLLLFWWSRTLEPAMLGATGSSGGRAKPAGVDRTGAVAGLIPRVLRRLVRPTAFGAIVARESRFWWRDPRRRASLVSILMASAVLPIVLQLTWRSGLRDTGVPTAASALAFSFAITIAGTMGGMLLANQFAFDGTAYATHLLQKVPGRTELRARALALALVVVPAEVVVVIAVTLLGGSPELVPAGLGMLATGFGGAAASASVLSVLAAYALPENTNPFALNTGGGSAKSLLAFVAMMGTLVLSAPITAVAQLLPGAGGAIVVGVLGLVYGGLLALVGTLIAGDLLDRRGPELLVAITPRR
jgi:ABC-2 type transport system permease protein